MPDDLPLVLGLEQWSAESGAPVPELSLAHKQSAWDKPLIKRNLAALMTSTTSEYHQARLKAVTSPHSGDWLLALPISACGLRLDDEAVRTGLGHFPPDIYPGLLPPEKNVNNFS